MDAFLKKIVEVSTGEKFSYDTSKTWIDLFKLCVEKNPEKIAVVDEISEMTYSELDKLSDKIAAYLLGEGVKENEFVAVRLGRVKEFVAVALGIHKIGAAYLPIDLDCPSGRISYMLEDSEAKITITEGIMQKILLSGSAEKFFNCAKPDNFAYMIYTSGSTGKPKGVVIQHKALLNFVHFIKNCYDLNEKSRIALHSNFAFDASIEDVYPPLIAGGTVFIVPENARHDIFEMRKFIAKYKINGGSYSTRFGQLLTDEKNSLDLNYITLGGEAMTTVPNVSGKIFNVYGPTEFTVDATYFELKKGKNYNPIPIGRPLHNCSAFIVSEKNELLPPGEIGELCLAGAQIAAGYWKRPELTAEKFSEIEVGDEKVKVYHTGDLARYNADNQLEFCGRIDFQVKLRGFRIELGEIENCAARFKDLSEVAAEIKNDTLCLYYTSKKEIDEKTLKNFLAEYLADYMIPSIFIRLEKMPMTANGKLDKKALPEPKFERLREYVEPQTELEKIVVECMKKVLGRNIKIGIKDNFFEIGGDSIKAIRMVSLLREQGIFAKANDVLKLRTVEKIAVACTLGKKFEISDKPFSGQVEDTAIFNFYKDLNLPDKKYFNQSTLLKLKNKISLETLQSALDKLTFQHDMLRAVIINEHLFVKSADTKIKIEEYTLAEDTKENIQNLCEKIQSNLNIENALVRAALIHSGERNLFFFTAHHTIIDGVSWRILLADLETALSGADLPKKTNTYQDYALAVKKYRDSYILAREIQYWQNVEKKILSLETSDGKNYTRHFSLLKFSMDKATTEKFLSAKLSTYNLEVNDLLLAAVGESYRKIFGKNSVSVQMEGHGREFIGKELFTDRTVGWFTSIYPVVLENLSGNPQQDLLNVKENLRRIPNKGVGYNILAFVDGKNPLTFEKNLIPKIIFNYLGNVSGEREEGEFFSPDIEDGFSSGLDYQSEKNCDGSDLAINCLIDEDKFSLWLNYNLDRIEEQKATEFAKEILLQIESFAKYLDGAEKIITASDLGETEWTAEEFNSVVEEFSARGEHLQRIYPLTPLQEGMLFAHVMNTESPAYRLVDIYELNFLPTEKELQIAIDALAEKHEIFRTAIIHEGVSIYRQAITDRKVPLTMVDLSESENKFADAKKIREKLLANGFDLQKKSLIQFICAKTSEKSCYIITAVHHIIVDGWCVDIYIADFEKFLWEARTSEKISIDNSNSGIYEKAVREIVSKDTNSAVEYFCKLLDGYENKAEIPTYGKIPESEQYFDNQIVEIIDATTAKNLENVCRKLGATLANGLELVWGMVIQTVCRLEDVVFGKVVSGRDNTSIDVSNLVGLFINTVPVRVKIEKNSSANELLDNLRLQSIEGNEFDFCPLADIQKAVGMTDNLVFSIISVENYGGRDEKNSLLKPLLYREENFGTFGFDATILADGSIEMIFSFDPAKHRESEVRRIISLTKNFMERIAENPAAPLNSLQLLNATDAEKILSISTGENFSYDTSKTWIDLFKMCVEKNPEKIAVVDENSEMNYSELDKLSDKIAAYLLGEGVKENEFVAVRLGRVKEFVAVVLGIQKIGAAYVPIDADYPADRVNYMLENSQAKITLTEDIVQKILLSKSAEKFFNRAKPDNFAYMIYTSGSTGKPKGVVIQHKALLNFVHFIKNCYDLNEKSRISCHPNFAFDASIENLFPPLIAGGTIFIVPEETRRDIFEMQKFIAKYKINGGSYSNRFGQLLTDEKNSLEMDYITLGGEAMTNPPNIRGKVFNAYGPTEFTVATTYFEVKKGKNYNPIPIGRPLYNCKCFIVDKNNRLLPQGMRGELCLAGAQISFGYWKRPELTAEKFAYIDIDGEKVKVYHTGDLARYNDDNQLEFCGRIDFQVKLRGFRIELGEIENRAEKFLNVVHVAADVKKNTLCLYYTSEKEIDEKSFKNFLAETLTDYMVPSIFIRLEKMPMTPSGKINRNLLPAPDLFVRQSEYEPPENEIERKLCETFAEILGMEKNSVGRNDNFFEIGGDSLKTLMVMSRAKIDGLSAKDIFKHKTARKIAEIFYSRESEDIDKFEEFARQQAIPATVEQIEMVDYQFLNVNSVMHNLSGFYRLDAKLDAEKLADAVNKVVRQHPALYSIFDFDDEGKIVQKIEPLILSDVEIVEIQPDDVEELSHTLLQPFKMFRKPLFRAKIFKCAETLYLFLDMHHIISDGTSLGILLEDISKAYHGEELGKDYYYTYLLKEYKNLNSEEFIATKKYFENIFGEKDWCEFPEPDYDSWEPQYGEIDIDPEISTEKMTAAEKRLGFSKNVLAVTAAVLALRDYSLKSAIHVDFLSSNRTEEYHWDTVGLMFRFLPVAVELENYSSLDKLLQEINRQVTDGFAHSICDYSSEGNIALRDALLVNYVSDMGDASELKGFNPTEIPLTSDKKTIGGHVDIYIMESDGAVNVALEYQRSAYKDESIQVFMDIFVKHLKILVNKN